MKKMTFLQFEETLKKLAKSQFFCVALSGGVDSIVLLNKMAEWRSQHPQSVIRAVHINHGLNQAADQWQQFCEAQCKALNIPFFSKTIEILDTGESVEAQAREKRYAVFEHLLKEEEVLLTGHHQDDQAETFLLQLMRGAGIKGLSAMGEKRKLGKGYLVRPFLSLSRDDIECYARQHHLDWIEDDSNAKTRFDRNYIRHEISPLFKKRWPHFSEMISRSARHCANAQSLLEEYLQQDYVALTDHAGALDLEKLKTFSQNRQWVLLRYWLVQQGCLLPSTKQLTELYRTVIEACTDANPHFQFSNIAVKRFRSKLMVLKHQKETAALNEKAILLQAYEQGLRKDIPVNELSIAFYQGGEKIRLSGRAFRHKLKKCWQKWGVPPWQRSSIPLVYYKEELVLVLGYAISEGFLEKQ